MTKKLDAMCDELRSAMEDLAKPRAVTPRPTRATSDSDTLLFRSSQTSASRQSRSGTIYFLTRGCLHKVLGSDVTGRIV